MHRWLLLLMIALLPLRGWAGDGMAAEMLAQQPAAGQQAVSRLDAMAMTMRVSHEAGHHGHDCVEQAQPAGDRKAAVQSEAPGEVSSCFACTTCQMCSSVALAFAFDIGPAAARAVPHPAWLDARFASADPAPGFKPPIS